MSDLIGNMREVCTLCLNAPSNQGAGAVDNYGALLTTRGQLSRSSGNRSLTFGDIQGNSSFTLTVRHQQAIESNIVISAKWLINNDFYTIESWEKVGQRDFYYKFALNKKEAAFSGNVDLSAISTTQLQSPLYLTTTANGNSIALNLPANAVIVLVARSGLIFNEVATNPGNFEFSYETGSLNFSAANPFVGEVVYVLYKLV